MSLVSQVIQCHWLIVGGESGPGARPMDVAWARGIVGQCKSSRTACFVKQLGAKPVWDGCGLVANNPRCPTTKEGINGREMRLLHPKDGKGGEPEEWPEDLRVREFPGHAPCAAPPSSPARAKAEAAGEAEVSNA